MTFPTTITALPSDSSCRSIFMFLLTYSLLMPPPITSKTDRADSHRLYRNAAGKKESTGGYMGASAGSHTVRFHFIFALGLKAEAQNSFRRTAGI